MAKNSRKKSTDGGLELDRINLSNIFSAGTGSQNSPGGQAQAPSRAPEKVLPKQKQNHLPLVMVLAVLALLMAFTALFKKQDISFTLMSGTEKSGPALENYLRVGPVTATLANDDIVKFSIEIDCRNAELKERLAGKDTQIRDRIIAVLTEPGTETLIKKNDYEAVKAKIKERLGDLGAGPIDDIYFSELLLY